MRELYQRRLEKLQLLFEEYHIDYYVEKSPQNIFYMTGIWEEEATMIISKKDGYHRLNIEIWTDTRLTSNVMRQIKLGQVKEYSEFADIWEEKEYIFTSNQITLAWKEKLESHVSVTIVSKDLIHHLRQTKDIFEIQAIEKACTITDNVYREIGAWLYEGITEREIAWLIEKAHREAGADGMSFSPIVAFGEHSASPHHTVTEKQLTYNTPILIDMGCIKNHYCSDMTRMLWFGNQVNEVFHHDFQTILEAQKIAIQSFSINTEGATLDKAVRTHLSKYKSERFFTHSLGHGIGIDVHDGGSLSIRSKTTIENSYVSTIEPGIYKNGQYGIRIEDIIVCIDKNKKLLSKSPRDLQVISR